MYTSPSTSSPTLLTHETVSLSNIDQTYQKLHTYTDFSSPDDSISAAAWDQYVINGFVALPHTWAQDRGWPLGREMPGDVEKGIYVVDGFHQLHCLVCFLQPQPSPDPPSNSPSHYFSLPLILPSTTQLIHPERCPSVKKSSPSWTANQ